MSIIRAAVAEANAITESRREIAERVGLGGMWADFERGGNPDYLLQIIASFAVWLDDSGLHVVRREAHQTADAVPPPAAASA